MGFLFCLRIISGARESHMNTKTEETVVRPRSLPNSVLEVEWHFEHLVEIYRFLGLSVGIARQAAHADLICLSRTGQPIAQEQ